MRILSVLLLSACLAMAAAVAAVPRAAADGGDTAPAAGPTRTTGDPWLDRQLDDIDRYAAHYRPAFLDELARYGGTSRAYAAALIQQPGWRAGDVWFACHWALASGRRCREVVRVRAIALAAGEDWSAVVQASGTRAAVAAALARVRAALRASYAHWDRPLAEPEDAPR